ncbi:unnamed protein product [Dimorphilus gyrociliatus]|uniref:Uncharacterized protein n=1 Tax=Dimorphilus gyrociliatus TaxID=2664684 RepID=A0A7I8W2S7_9ANNE|nr:unnamed protein product [Dimorphilus gyrociliatus]
MEGWSSANRRSLAKNIRYRAKSQSIRCKRISTNSRNINNDYAELKIINKTNGSFQPIFSTRKTSSVKITSSFNKRARRKSCGCCPCRRYLDSEEIIQLSEEPEGVERITPNPGRNLRLEDDIISTLEELPLDELPAPPRIVKQSGKRSVNKSNSRELISDERIAKKSESQLNNKIGEEQKQKKTALGSDSVIALEKRNVVEAEKEAVLESKIERENFLELQNGKRSKEIEANLPLIDKSNWKQKGDSKCLSSEKAFRKLGEVSPVLNSLTNENQKGITISTNLQSGLEDSYRNFPVQFPLSFITSNKNRRICSRQHLPFFITDKGFNETLPPYLTNFWFRKAEKQTHAKRIDMFDLNEKLIEVLGTEDDIIQKVIKGQYTYTSDVGKHKWNLNRVKSTEGFTNEMLKDNTRSAKVIDGKSIKKRPTKHVSPLLPLPNKVNGEQVEPFDRRNEEDIKEDALRQLRTLIEELNRKASYASRRKNEISVPQIARRQRSMEYIRKEYMGNMHKLIDIERPTTGFLGTLPLLKFTDVESIEFTDSVVGVGKHSVIIGGYYSNYKIPDSLPKKTSNERDVVAIKLYEKNVKGALAIVDVFKEAAILSYLFTDDSDNHLLIPKLIGLLQLEESYDFLPFALVTKFIGNRETMEILTMDIVLVKETDSRKQGRIIIENSQWIEMLINLAKFIRKCHRKLVVVNNLKLTNIAFQRLVDGCWVHPIPLNFSNSYRINKCSKSTRYLNSFEPDITQFGCLIKSVDLCLNLGLEKITSHCQTSTPVNLYWSLCDIIDALEASLKNVGRVLEDEKKNKKTLEIDNQKKV